MIPGLNPKKMQAMMKQMGMAQEEIEATRVIIEKPEGKIIIENPSVSKINMQGNVNFQISGDIVGQEQESDTIEKLKEDIQTIVAQAGCTEEEAAIELEKTGDIVESIINLSK